MIFKAGAQGGCEVCGRMFGPKGRRPKCASGDSCSLDALGRSATCSRDSPQLQGFLQTLKQKMLIVYKKLDQTFQDSLIILGRCHVNGISPGFKP